MQNPPPGPPPGGEPPNYPPPAATGIDKKTGSILSYLLWWITGIIFLFVGKDDPDVKYHAAQSTVFFGSVTVASWILWIVGGFMGPLAFLFGALGFAVIVYGVVVWVMCLIQASNGGGARFPIPWVGGVVTPYAEQLANAIR